MSSGISLPVFYGQPLNGPFNWKLNGARRHWVWKEATYFFPLWDGTFFISTSERSIVHYFSIFHSLSKKHSLTETAVENWVACIARLFFMVKVLVIWKDYQSWCDNFHLSWNLFQSNLKGNIFSIFWKEIILYLNIIWKETIIFSIFWKEMCFSIIWK